jgi:hypothetical protein
LADSSISMGDHSPAVKRDEIRPVRSRATARPEHGHTPALVAQQLSLTDPASIAEREIGSDPRHRATVREPKPARCSRADIALAGVGRSEPAARDRHNASAPVVNPLNQAGAGEPLDVRVGRPPPESQRTPQRLQPRHVYPRQPLQRLHASRPRPSRPAHRLALAFAPASPPLRFLFPAHLLNPLTLRRAQRMSQDPASTFTNLVLPPLPPGGAAQLVVHLICVAPRESRAGRAGHPRRRASRSGPLGHHRLRSRVHDAQAAVRWRLRARRSSHAKGKAVRPIARNRGEAHRTGDHNALDSVAAARHQRRCELPTIDKGRMAVWRLAARLVDVAGRVGRNFGGRLARVACSKE